jgi:hypothetical protein
MKQNCQLLDRYICSQSFVACRAVAMNDREMGGYTRAVSGQRLGKHVPAATGTNATVEELCFLCGPCRDIVSKGQV